MRVGLAFLSLLAAPLSPPTMDPLRVLSWNVEKRDLVDWSLHEFKADVALFQEYDASVTPRLEGYEKFEAISFDSYGTAVIVNNNKARIKSTAMVKSPHGDYRAQFWKGLVYKATAIVTLDNGLTVVSFHGFNGSLQGRSPQMLVDHVEAVMKAIPTSGPCVFAGDFNTFTDEHHTAMTIVMAKYGFGLSVKVPYDSKKTLDLVYTRRCSIATTETGHHESDHPFNVYL